MDIIAGAGAREIAQKICEANGISFESVKRLVIDFNLNDVVTIYIEKYADAKTLSIDFSLKGIELISEDLEIK